MRKSIMILIAVLISMASNGQWYQVGPNLIGQAISDKFGQAVCLSADGSVLAVGAPYNDASGSNAGHVRVYNKVGASWVQKGLDLEGEAGSNLFGHAVSLSADGNTLAIGAPDNDAVALNSGHVRVFEWNAGAWVQKGIDLDGQSSYDEQGFSVSLSDDGNKMAVGCQLGNVVRMYEWNGAAWLLTGTFNSETGYDDFGHSVSMSAAGTTVAIGGPQNDGNGSNAGHVRVFRWNGLFWVQKGGDIDGLVAGDQFGYAVSLSDDGNTLVAGAPFNDVTGFESGHARVFEWNGTSWVQKGTGFAGESNGDRSGWSVSISADGDAIAVGAIDNDGGGTQSGHTRVFIWNGFQWIQRGLDIDGLNNYNSSGEAVCLSADGNFLAIGAPAYSNLYGKVRVVTNCSRFNTINETVCNSYTVPSGDETYSVSGVYQDTLPSSLLGCDSIISINLTVNSSSSTINASACSSYTVPSGDETYTVAGTYSDTLTNAAGCDSIITIHLNLNNSSSSISVSSCSSSYIAPDGQVYTSSGQYVAVIPNNAGCDSSIQIDLTFLLPSSDDIAPVVCNSYTAPDGQVYTNSGQYVAVIPNAVGCDSTINIDLIVNQSSTSSISTAVCDTYTAADGQVYSTSGQYTAVIPNAAGCDSTITINLTVNQSTSSTVSPIVCDVYTAPDGQVYNLTGQYVAIVQNAVGCDSTITIDLTVHQSTSSSITEIACDAYTAPDGQLYMSSGQYAAVIPNSFGCDSTITIDLTVLSSSAATIAPTVCDSYTAPDGQTYTSTGQYVAVIPNTVGCDSTITINLTVNQSSSSSLATTVCNQYTAPDGQIYTTSGQYVAVISNAAGCDSTIAIDLTVNQSSSNTIAPTACETYTAPDGQVYSTSGQYVAIISNALGCDSTITINLIVNQSSSGTLVTTACDSFTAPDGQVYTSSGQFVAVIPDNAGCDSTISINLTVGTSYYSITDVSACNEFFWEGTTYTASGTYLSQFVTSLGCDSILELNLTITTVDTSVSVNGIVLTANQSNASYQWVDCNNNFTPIAGETNASFTPTSNGLYAVEITVGQCTSISNCHAITTVGVNENTNEIDFTVWPNPTHGLIVFQTSKPTLVTVAVLDIAGKVIQTKEALSSKFEIDLSEHPDGIYFVKCSTKHGSFVKKVIKH